MGAQVYNGIVLRYANYKENDRILTIFTREAGLLSASSRGCRRPKSQLLGASEAFVYGEFLLFERSGGKFSVESCDVRESFYPIREDMARLAGGISMLKLVENSGADLQAERLFSTLYYALSYLAYTPIDPMDLTLCFFIRALSELGMQPASVQCACCGRDLRTEKKLFFSSERGGAVCGDCAFNAEPIDALSLEALRRMLLLSDEDMQKVRLPRTVQIQLKKNIKEFAAYNLEYDFKSLDQI